MGNTVDCFSGFDSPNLIVAVKTGDTKGVGLHNCAYVTFIDEAGKTSQELCLTGNCFTVFKRGHTDVFTFRVKMDIGPIAKVKLCRSELNEKRFVDWFVEKIEVRRYFGELDNLEKKEELVFPCHRWIRNKRPVVLEYYDCSLPQHCEEGEQREMEIFWKRQMYRYHRIGEGLPPQVSFCPKEEVFTGNNKWDVMVRKQAMVSKYKLPHFEAQRWESFYEFDDIYGKKLSTPAGRELWRDDFHFGRQRLCGCNPTLITLCKAIPDGFGVTTGMVEPLLEGLSLQEAMETNRIFMVNLEILSRLNNDQIPSPFALFFLNGKKSLMPIAIQLFQQKGEDNPVFLPSDPWYTWTLAKMWYNNAEAQHHRACSLIGYTHLFLEAVAIATHRNLSPSHPVFRLLAPFIRDIIPINCFELNELLAPRSWIDKATTLGSQGTMNLLSLGWQEWRLDIQGCLPKDLSARGVDDLEVLPDYPYRDDSLPLYHAIENFVRNIIDNKYLDSDILAHDSELRDWSRELAADGNDGCSIKGVPGNGLISSPDELVMVLTSIIFMSTVGHSAVNTPQYEEYGYLPNYPAILQGSPPRDKSWREESSILACLPSKSVSLDIMVITKLLSEKHSYGLSNLSVHYLYHPDDVKAWERFVDDLRGISHTIQDRNRKRCTVYDYINPIRTLWGSSAHELNLLDRQWDATSQLGRYTFFFSTISYPSQYVKGSIGYFFLYGIVMKKLPKITISYEEDYSGYIQKREFYQRFHKNPRQRTKNTLSESSFSPTSISKMSATAKIISRDFDPGNEEQSEIFLDFLANFERKEDDSDDSSPTAEDETLSPRTEKTIKNNGTALQELMRNVDELESLEVAISSFPCVLPQRVGRLQFDTRPRMTLKMEEARHELPFVAKGGSWKPTKCQGAKVAIVIPFRDRYPHLSTFLKHMHRFLRWQMLDYRIFVIEQSGIRPFNRGMLMNIGFREAMKKDEYICVIFHDVDLIPEDDRNDYSCPSSPRHMSTAVDTMKYKLGYKKIFGGVEAFWPDHFKKANGFPNRYWGWGGEDDDLYVRVMKASLGLTRPAHQIGRYYMIKHKKSKGNPERHAMLRESHVHIERDGLNSLTYKVLSNTEHPLYTMIVVDLTSKDTSDR